jgi:mannose/cellobiose epimerase-like protein (N-acyl-D-glucosamine 2-epimerase family)
MPPDPHAPDFLQPATLRQHVDQILGFYFAADPHHASAPGRPRAVDPTGGLFHHFRDDGLVLDRHTRHLVSSARFVFVCANALRHTANPAYLDLTLHALDFVEKVHRDPHTGGYAWQVHWDGQQALPDRRRVIDGTNHCYGLAFVLLAHAHALRAGVIDSRRELERVFDLMDLHFWQPEHGLYADEADPDWHLRPYRGQNANMHACEAMIAAFEATGETHYLDRAQTLATSITIRQAMRSGTSDHLVWEHYTPDWSPDWEYHRADRSDQFRPWGFQPGHLAEWAKLLLSLERHRPLSWLLPRATQLYDAAMRLGWDAEHSGLVYSLDLDGRWHDTDKLFWVQAEALAAAAFLWKRWQVAHEPERSQHYRSDYRRHWAYADKHFVDHEHGGWYRLLSRDNRKASDAKSPPGKVDYHTTGACWEVLRILDVG